MGSAAAYAGPSVSNASTSIRHSSSPERPWMPVLAGNAAPPSFPNPASTDRKSTRLNSSHLVCSYAVFCLKKDHLSVVRMRHHLESCMEQEIIHPCGGKPQVFKSEFFFFNDTAATEIYTLSLHDALPI